MTASAFARRSPSASHFAGLDFSSTMRFSSPCACRPRHRRCRRSRAVSAARARPLRLPQTLLASAARRCLAACSAPAAAPAPC
eukprot:236839-Prymnesium_polylepis.1